MQLYDKDRGRDWPYDTTWTGMSIMDMSGDQALSHQEAFVLAWQNIFYETKSGKLGVMGQLDTFTQGKYSDGLGRQCALWSGSDIAATTTADGARTIVSSLFGVSRTKHRYNGRASETTTDRC